jgi:hypothetical protein
MAMIEPNEPTPVKNENAVNYHLIPSFLHQFWLELKILLYVVDTHALLARFLNSFV